MKFLLFRICLLLSTLTINPTKEYTIALSENLTPKGTFSCEIGAKKSFHIVIAKNADKKYTLVPMRVMEDKMVTFNFVGAFEKLPSILSYHNNGEILTLVLSIDKKKPYNLSLIHI